MFVLLSTTSEFTDEDERLLDRIEAEVAAEMAAEAAATEAAATEAAATEAAATKAKRARAWRRRVQAHAKATQHTRAEADAETEP
jgi:hypothetical protein